MLTPEREELTIQPVLSVAAVGRATIEIATSREIVERLPAVPPLVASS